MGKKGAQALDKNPFWKGGRVIASNGYVLIKKPDHPMSDVRGYVYEHRLVAEKKLGRLLEAGEIVHHLDGDKQNNTPENLEVVKGIANHFFRHRKIDNDRQKPGQENIVIHCACGCGKTFLQFDKYGRPRRYISGHNMNVRVNQ